MFRKFIENPVLSTVISIIIVILGLLGLASLPISQYPEIAPPTVVVNASYQGASANVVLKSVIIPLEEQINGVENMSYMTSTASSNGSAAITIFFKQGTNPDMAAVNVQNRVAKATSLLPNEVIKAGITTSKQLSSTALSFLLYSNDGKYDEKFLDNYLRINIMPELKRVAGVGGAEIYSSREYSMRIWLKPDAMANQGLVPDDIIAALQEQNIEAAPGKIGENSKESVQYSLKFTGRLENPEEFENIVLRSDKQGSLLRLKDVADIEFGALDYTSSLITQGKVSSGGQISQISGSNARELIIACENILKKASKDFPPGVEYHTFLNANDFLDASIEKVIYTIIEAFILVFIVVFVFLQDFRSTLIPAIAVPVSIIGTFFFLKLFGFTINLLTLFALVLAIGIVVDDAIVVVEAVHAKLDQGAKSAKKATIHAMSEISGAIISITLIMSAVFVPVTFITGSAGVFYKQFGLTLAVAILISAVNALTLSPALCAILLKPHDPEKSNHNNGFLPKFYASFNVAFDAVTRKYIGSVRFLIRRKWISLVAIAVFGIIFYALIKTTPTGFVPNEDGGAIYGNVVLPASSTLERTEQITKEIDSIARSIPEIELSSTLSGMDLIHGNGGSYGALFIRLKPWKERKGKNQDVNSVVAKLFEKTAHIKGASIIFFASPTLQGFGNNNGFEVQLQDRTGGSYQDFDKNIAKFMAAINKRPEIMYATNPFNITFPEMEVNVNVAKCKEAGVSVKTVLNTLQGYFGGIYASDINKFGKQYRVMLQSHANYRAKESDINKVFVRTDKGAMAPISEFVTLKKTYGPEFINRFNLFTSTTVTGAPNAGYSSGDAIKAIEEVAAQTLDRGYAYEFSGLTKEELSSGSQTTLIFGLCLIFIYFLLSAQYKSYILPFSVLLSLPIGLAGAFIFANLFGVDNNIFLQISLIMLIGLLAKNAILIVEFALLHRLSGRGLVQSALFGAKARLRPILMTSFAFIFGLIPLMIATGAGALSNRSIGTAAVGGMLIGTLFGVFVIPVLFIIFQSLQEKVGGVKEPSHEPREIH
ncbi:Efflux pump membrane transporter BepE [Flavobacterium bizetiae]|uniref:Efflux pump membrane transporter BepE n=1 Tax=Flavobacterium bizetiae TaxID=2704140 RepID=A0A6J4G9F4_9FLAO|nr:efflux RND transporter permease subunit [Flavobacterium bizetiae]CAA9195718.1 Efflux pump membrane transporter BepE [Flavobacterium bizetiae]CAD5340435.1 Efflux pump membrane transporter BepE [Flavobacterium bizetiae]CAD5346838.1 Efflux pump membrane transporter BepE [Flavobacterium bizetiae]